MSDRNLNPHAEARVAMALWSDRYSKQKLGCMDFYDGLTAGQKSICAQIVDGIIYADRADGRTPAPPDNVVLPNGWTVTPTRELMDDVMALPDGERGERWKAETAKVDAMFAPSPVSKDSGVSVEQLGEPVCLVHPAGHQPCSQVLAEGLVGSVPHSPPVSVSDDDISCSTAHAADAYPASTPMSTAKLEDQP